MASKFGSRSGFCVNFLIRPRAIRAVQGLLSNSLARFARCLPFFATVSRDSRERAVFGQQSRTSEGRCLFFLRRCARKRRYSQSVSADGSAAHDDFTLGRAALVSLSKLRFSFGRFRAREKAVILKTFLPTAPLLMTTSHWDALLVSFSSLLFLFLSFSFGTLLPNWRRNFAFS